MMGRATLAGHVAIALFGLLGTAGCFWPRAEDAPARRDFYRQWTQREAPCDRLISVFPAQSAPGRPSRELANMSATCSPGSIELCERDLKERACALGADAVLMAEPEPGPNPAGGSRQSLVSRSGRAVRWTD
jgi:hypothetical protein